MVNGYGRIVVETAEASELSLPERLHYLGEAEFSELGEDTELPRYGLRIVDEAYFSRKKIKPDEADLFIEHATAVRKSTGVMIRESRWQIEKENKATEERFLKYRRILRSGDSVSIIERLLKHKFPNYQTKLSDRPRKREY